MNYESYTKDKVTLRKLNSDDEDVLLRLANNPEIAKNLRDRFPQPYTAEDARFFINLGNSQDPCSILAITYEEELVGVIGLEREEDVHRNTAEIGYWIGEPFWNKGIVTIAVSLMTRYGFEILNLKRIHTGIYEHNPASMRVLEKCGYEFEGIFKANVFKNGKYLNEHRYSKIAE